MSTGLQQWAIILGIGAAAVWVRRSVNTIGSQASQATLTSNIVTRPLNTAVIIQAGAPSFGKPANITGLEAKSGKSGYVQIQRPMNIPNRNRPVEQVVKDTQIEAGRILDQVPMKAQYLLSSGIGKSIPMSTPQRNQMRMQVIRNSVVSTPPDLKDNYPGTRRPRRPRSSFHQWGGRAAMPASITVLPS